MASKWSVSTKRNKPAVKNKSRPPARINGARGRLRAFSCLFLNAWGFESPYGVKWAMRISQTAVFGASDPYFRKSNFSVPNPPVFSSECKNTALSCGVFAVHLFYQHNLEVTPGFEPGNQGFADPCLTTWLCHHHCYYYMRSFRKSPHLFLRFQCPHRFSVWALNWSGQRGSNSLPPPWQGGALPDELCPQVVPRAGIEPATRGFSVHCSTN